MKVTPGKRPRVLVVASTYPRWPGDHEPGFVHELARRLTDKCDVTVLCPHAENAARREYLQAVEVIRHCYAPAKLETLVNDGGMIANIKQQPLKMLLLPLFFLSQFLYLAFLIGRIRPDVIHAHWIIPQGLTVALATRLPGLRRPFVVTSHGADLFALQSGLFRRIKCFVINRANRITVVSRAMKQAVTDLGARETKVDVIPMGVDLKEKFTPDPAIERKPASLLFVGRLVEKKGLEFALRAMPAVISQQSSAILNIAGYGPEQSRLKALAKELAITEQVHFLGAVAQDRLPDLYREASIFIAPFITSGDGDQEGLGLVTIEAIGCGCPVILSDVAAARDVSAGLQSVATVPMADSEALAEAIVSALANSQKLSAQATGAREQVMDRFDWISVANRYQDLLVGVASQ